MDIEQVMETYFAAMRAKDSAPLRQLYAEDATFCLPDGREFSGRETICGMHESVFAAGAPVPTPGARILSGQAGAVEIEAMLADGTVRHTTNHFYLNGEGRIERLNVYMKGAM